MRPRRSRAHAARLRAGQPDLAPPATGNGARPDDSPRQPSLREPLARAEQRIAALEQRLAQAEAAERMLDALMEYLPEGIAIADTPDVNLVRMSRHGGRLAGMSAGPVMGVPLAKLVEGWSLLREEAGAPGRWQDLPLSRAVRQGEVVADEEWFLQSPTGERATIQCSAGPIRGADGTITGGVASWHDITEARRSQERLHRLGSLRGMVWYAQVASDADGGLHWQFQFPSMEAARKFLPVRHTPDQTFVDAWHAARLPGDHEAATRTGTEAVRAGRDYEAEYRCRLADESIRWVHEDVAVETLEEGKHWRAIGLCTDVTARKEAEDGLAWTLREAGVGWFGISLVYDVAALSPEYAAMLGISPEDCPTRDGLRACIHPDDLARCDAVCDAACARHEDAVRLPDMRVRHADGTWRWHQITYRLHYRADGKAMWATAIAVEVTERRATEERIRELARFPEENPNPVARVGADGAVLYANAAARLMFAAMGWRDGGPLPGRLRPLAQGAAQASAPLRAEVRGVRGRVFSCVCSSGADTRSVNLYALDITDRKEREREVRALNAELDRERKRWREVVQGIGDEVWLCDAEGRLSLLNVPDVTAMGLTPFQGKTIDQVLEEVEILTPDGEPRPPEQAPLLLSLRGQTVRGEEIMRHRATGRTRWRQFTSAPLRDAAGKVTGAVAVVRDVTAEQQARQEIERLNARLRWAMNETHHRVKNNLQVIAGIIDVQIDNAHDAVPVHELRTLSQHVRALAAIHELLTAQSKAGDDTEGVPAGTVLGRLLRAVEAAMTGRRIGLDVDDMVLPSRQASALAIVVNELVANALKHGRGDVAVSLHVHDGQAELAVHDDGPGFPQGFDPAAAARTGLELVQMLARWDLAGTVAFGGGPEGGGRAVVRFPVPPV